MTIIAVARGLSFPLPLSAVDAIVSDRASVSGEGGG